MAPRKPKVEKHYNSRFVEYPLNEAFMTSLSYEINRQITQEVMRNDGILQFTSQQVLDAFVLECDHAMAKSAMTFFISHVWPRQFTFDNFYTAALVSEDTGGIVSSLKRYPATLKYIGNHAPLALPAYVTHGPVNNLFGETARDRIRDSYRLQEGVAARWLTVYAMVSTLNHICSTVSDIIANFPALEVLCRPTSMSAFFKNLKPVNMPTKMPPELRAVYKEATRTVNRLTLVDDRVHIPDNVWVVDFDVPFSWPDWLSRSPGFRIPE